MRQRVATAAIGIPVVLACLLAPTPVPLGVLLVVLAVLGLHEGTNLAKSSAVWVAGGVLGIVGAIAWWAAAHGRIPVYLMSGLIGGSDSQPENRTWDSVDLCLLAAIGLALAASFALSVAVRYRGRLAGASRGTAIGVWIVAPLLALLMTHAEVGSKVILAVVPVWAGDVAAIFAGRQWGRRQLAPAISPGKTWEGAFAGLFASVAAGAALAPALSVDWGIAVGCGLAAGILGPAGDLLESRLKREAGVKDSGTLLPGHGGVLDRIDSILLAAPVSCLLLVFG